MKIQTMSLVVGTRACNARCPFCVSQMTGFGELPKTREINKRNLRKAMHRAKMGGVTTALLTGKGEPTLYPRQIEKYLEIVGKEFPAIELQTNGLEIGRLAAGKKSLLDEATLHGWWIQGLDTIALSVVSIHPEHNREVYHEDYPDLTATVSYLHQLGFSVRLCVMMQKGYVDIPEKLEEVVMWCKAHGVEQLTVRPIRQPKETSNGQVSDYVYKRALFEAEVNELYGWVEENGTLLLSLMHGAEVYDIEGQNICISDCLTLSDDPEQIRQLIFYADGRITYDWQYEGALLLGGRP